MENKTKISYKHLFAYVGLGIMVSFLFFNAYLIVINQNTGFQYFKNLEYGTDLEVVVAPHGIYTYKYVHLEYFCECKKFNVFVNTAEYFNATVYWIGNNGDLFWFYLGDSGDAVTGLYFKVPLKWFPDDTMKNCTW